MSCGTLIETICYNWTPELDEQRLQLLVYNRSIHPDLVGPAKEKVEAARANWPSRSTTGSTNSKHNPRIFRNRRRAAQQLGLGLYYFQ